MQFPRKALLALAVLAASCIARAHTGPAGSTPPKDKKNPAAVSAKQVEALWKLLEQRIATEPFLGEMSFARFLNVLEEQMPKDKRISFRIDEKAFGKNYEAVAKTPIQFSKNLKRLLVVSALRLALSKLDPEADFIILPPHVVVTTPEMARFTKTYEVTDLVKDAKRLARAMAPLNAQTQTDINQLKAEDDTDVLLNTICLGFSERFLEPQIHSLQILNGAKLVVHGNHGTHSTVVGRLGGLRRVLDLDVVMQARLVEVEREFYLKEIEPLSWKPCKQRQGWTLPTAIPKELLDKLKKKRAVVEGDFLKIPPGEAMTFLGLEQSFRYQDATGTRIGREGVTFKVRAEVSPDRRAMRLEIAQGGARLVKIDKLKVLDAATGREREVESPNLQKTQELLKVQLEDGQAFLWALTYRSPTAQSKDRLWLLVAEPIIYIEEEKEAIRKGLISDIPHDPNYKPPVPVKPARSEDMEQLFQAIIKDVMTDPGLKMFRDRYALDGRSELALMDSDLFVWPEWFEPWLPGKWRLREPPDSFERRPKVLGVRIDRFQLDPKHKEHGIHVVLTNEDGVRHLGEGEYLRYRVRRDGKRWLLEQKGEFDP